MADVFISYKSERRPAVSYLARTIENYGFTVWFDYGLLSGSDFGRQIERELRAARAVLVLWCPLSVDSEWVLEEATLAKRLGSMIPVKLMPVELPMGFQRADTVNIAAWDGAPRSHNLDKLIEQLAARVGREPTARFQALIQQERDWRIAGPKLLADYPLDQKAGASDTLRRLEAERVTSERASGAPNQRLEAEQKTEETARVSREAAQPSSASSISLQSGMHKFRYWKPFGLICFSVGMIFYVSVQMTGSGDRETKHSSAQPAPSESSPPFDRTDLRRDQTASGNTNPSRTGVPLLPSKPRFGLDETPQNNGSSLASASGAPATSVLKRPVALVATLSGHGWTVKKAVYSPDGSRIVTGSEDSSAIIWDSKNGAQLATLKSHSDGYPMYDVAFSQDGLRVITASGDYTARIWNAANGVELVVLKGHSDWVFSAEFSVNGRLAVTGSRDKTFRIWNATTGALLTTVKGHGNFVLTASFSPDGSRVITGSSDKTARIWDTATGALVTSLVGHGDTVVSASFSPDGSRVVTASSDKTARIWDAATGAQLKTLEGHSDGVSSAAFSPDGRRIVTASRDSTARIWDADTGASISVLKKNRYALESAAFSPDGRRVVTASQDRTARIWDVSGL